MLLLLHRCNLELVATAGTASEPEGMTEGMTGGTVGMSDAIDVSSAVEQA